MERKPYIPEWFTLAELAERWKCTTDSLRGAIAAKKLRATKLPGGWRVERSEVERRERPGIRKTKETTYHEADLLAAFGA